MSNNEGRKLDDNKPEYAYLGRTDTWWHSSPEDPNSFYRLASYYADTFWFKGDKWALLELLRHINRHPDFDLDCIITVSKSGAQKYGLLNYRKGLAWSRLFSSLRRHLYHYPLVFGEAVDEETNMPHWAHAYCCAAFLYEYATENLGTDDRT